MDLNVDKILKDRYKILRKISIGQFSVLYTGTDLHLNRKVVLKIFSTKNVDLSKLNLTFQNELKITARLTHPNIVHLYDYFIEPNYLVLVLEYIDGITLRSLLKEKFSLDVETTVKFVIQILEGLQYAYSNNVIHRDLKPSNILITNNKHVKILDFGLAIDQFNQKNQFFKRELTGSLHYLSPESIQDRNLISVQSDIYSIGIMFYEFLIGQKPFHDVTPQAILNKHLYAEIPSIKNFDDNISGVIQNVILKATAKNLNERYKTPQAMLVDLYDYLQNPDKIIKPLKLKFNVYKGNTKIPFKLQNPKKIKFFWLTNTYLFLFVFVNILMFLAILIGITINKLS